MKTLLINKRFLHVLSGFSTQVIIKAPCPITSYVLCSRECSESGGESWQVLVLTASNTVYLTQVHSRLDEIDRGSTESEAGNQGIFSELLDQDSPPFLVAPATDPVIHLQDKHVILQSVDPLLHIEVAGKLLLTLTAPPEPSAKVYHLQDLITHKKDQTSKPCLVIPCPTFQFASDADRHGLYVACCGRLHDGWTSTKTLHLPTVLFSALFKAEAVLLESYVILYTLNGATFFHQVKSQSLSGDQWEILCDMVGSVVGLFTIDIKTEKSDLSLAALQPGRLYCDTRLLVCSSTGKVMFIHLPGTNNEINYDFVSLPGQNVCSQMTNSCLYHCTGKRLYKHLIKICSGGDNPVSLETDFLHECLVANFVVLEEAQDEHLLCVSAQEEILTLPTMGGTKPDADPNTLKDLVSALTDSSTRMDEIRQHQQHMNAFLGQVSIAGHLLCKGKLNQKFGGVVPVSSKCRIVSQKSGYRLDYSLICTITNQAPQQLSNQWSLLVVIETEADSQVETWSHGMPLSYGLKSGSNFELKVPMAASCVMCMYCDVSVYLVLHSALLEDEENYSLHVPLPSSSRRALPVLVATHRLDVLHYLHQPITELAGSSVSVTESALSQLVRNKPINSKERQEEDTGTNRIFTFAILTRAVPLPEDSKEMWQETDTKANKILKLLLRDTQVQLQVLQRGQVQLMDTAGHIINITIETQTGDGGREEVEIRLGSESLGLLARCSTAINERLETMLADDSGEITIKRLRNYLSKIENIKEEVCNVEVSPGSGSKSNDERWEIVGRLYEKLRNTHI